MSSGVTGNASFVPEMSISSSPRSSSAIAGDVKSVLGASHSAIVKAAAILSFRLFMARPSPAEGPAKQHGGRCRRETTPPAPQLGRAPAQAASSPERRPRWGFRQGFGVASYGYLL